MYFIRFFSYKLKVDNEACAFASTKNELSFFKRILTRHLTTFVPDM